MEELIKVTKDDKGISVVSGRELHDFFGSNRTLFILVFEDD